MQDVGVQGRRDTIKTIQKKEGGRKWREDSSEHKKGYISQDFPCPALLWRHSIMSLNPLELWSVCTFCVKYKGAIPSLQGHERQHMYHRLLLILDHKIISFVNETKNICEEIWIFIHYRSHSWLVIQILLRVEYVSADVCIKVVNWMDNTLNAGKKSRTTYSSS